MAGRAIGSRNSRFHKCTPEQHAFITEIVFGRSHREITGLVNDRFGTDLTADQVKAFISRNKLNTGRTGRFEKGSVPANKGTKGLSSRNRTTFAKGNTPINRVPIGTEKHREDGYVYVKVQDGCKNANWKQKHLVVWEAANGPVRADHVVLFANGDRTDIRLENLVLAERADLAVMNRFGLHGCDAESSTAAVLTAKVIRKARSRSKKTKEVSAA